MKKAIETAKETLLLLKEKEGKRYSHTGSNNDMSTQLENETHFDTEFFQQKLPHHYRNVLIEFQKISRAFVRFNVLFIGIIGAQLASLFIFLPIFSQTSLLALGLGTLFLSAFSYLVLLFYYQAKKPEQLNSLLHRFIASCRTAVGLPTGVAQHHLSIADTLSKLSSYLQDYEWSMGQIPKIFSPLSSLFSRVSAYCYWHDVFRFKQLLLYAAIDEHLLQIRATPTDLEVHASLANAYVSLSQIYKEPKGVDTTHPRQSLYNKHERLFSEKFKTAARLALEEFRILSHYAPQDPWVHDQLAAGYRDLEMPEEEILEVETLLKLRPQDKDILFRLGTLYFQQGLNAKGLQAYEELQKANFKKAEDLIASYGQTGEAEMQITPIEV